MLKIPIDNRCLFGDTELLLDIPIYRKTPKIKHMISTRRRPLGELEMAVLEHLWGAGSASAKAVHSALGVSRGITLNTVQSTLERLHHKGLLRREKVSHAYIYAPQVLREELMAQLIGEVIAVFTGNKSQALLSAFVDLAAQVDEQNLDRLERLIAARRMQAQEPKRS
jgi:predicted transcriptional regulator